MAGVSVTTVSFVLNNKPGVSDAIRKNVQDIIDKTNFKPNLNSRKLLKKKSFNICLIINSSSSPFEDLFYFDVARGILNQGYKYGYNLIMSKIGEENDDLPNLVYSGETDGIIFFQNVTSKILDKAQKCGIPFVIVDSHSSIDSISSVNPDYCNATCDAVNYLIDQGHKNIAMIAKKEAEDFYKQTFAGFKKALNDNGLAIRKDQKSLVASNEDNAYEIAKKLLASPNAPSAILCTTDIFAIGTIRAAKDCKLKVPNDVSIMGIDDIFLSRYIEPRLTTVGINKEDMGVYAMDLLYKKMKGKKPDNILLPMNLVIRDSVKNINNDKNSCKYLQ